MELQTFQDRHVVRIKFAIVDQGSMTSYAGEQSNYAPFWSKFPDTWVELSSGEILPSTTSSPHTAKHFSTPFGDVVAVEYETGLELLALGIAAAGAAASIYQAYQIWRANRNRTSTIATEDLLEIETRSPDGTSSTVKIPAHLVTAEHISQVIDKT